MGTVFGNLPDDENRRIVIDVQPLMAQFSGFEVWALMARLSD